MFRVALKRVKLWKRPPVPRWIFISLKLSKVLVPSQTKHTPRVQLWLFSLWEVSCHTLHPDVWLPSSAQSLPVPACVHIPVLLLYILPSSICPDLFSSAALCCSSRLLLWISNLLLFLTLMPLLPFWQHFCFTWWRVQYDLPFDPAAS